MGEAHHGRCPGAIAKLIDTTIKELILGMNPLQMSKSGEKFIKCNYLVTEWVMLLQWH